MNGVRSKAWEYFMITQGYYNLSLLDRRLSGICDLDCQSKCRFTYSSCKPGSLLAARNSISWYPAIASQRPFATHPSTLSIVADWSATDHHFRRIRFQAKFTSPIRPQEIFYAGPSCIIKGIHKWSIILKLNTNTHTHIHASSVLLSYYFLISCEFTIIICDLSPSLP